MLCANQLCAAKTQRTDPRLLPRVHRPHSATNECQRHQSARDQSFDFCHPHSQSNPRLDTHSAAAGVDTNLTQFTSRFRTITDRFWPVGVLTGRQPVESLRPLYFCLFGDLQCIVNLNSEVAHRALQFRVAQEQLHDAQVLGSPVNQRRLRTSQGVRAIRAGIETDLPNPTTHDPRILPRGQPASVANVRSGRSARVRSLRELPLYYIACNCRPTGHPYHFDHEARLLMQSVATTSTTA
jgi:hypothetical protein